MVQYKLTESDKENILKDNVFTVSDLRDYDVEYIIGFLNQYIYHKGYKRSFIIKRPKHWTKAYSQAVDKIECFFKYGDDLNNGPALPN